MCKDEFNYYSPIRSESAHRIELLKKQNLSCSSCCHYAKSQGKCKAKNSYVKSYNICDIYGKVLLK